jgi:hypothetical protein
VAETQVVEPCRLCLRLGLGETPGEWHHFQTGSLRDNEDGCRLCAPHHRLPPFGIHVMGKKAWLKHFGLNSERELLELSEPE